MRLRFAEELESRCLLHAGHESSEHESKAPVSAAAAIVAAVNSPAIEDRYAGGPFAGQAVANAPTPVGAPGDEMLPDMFSWADASRGYMYGSYIDTATEPGHRLLRFSTAVPNTGTGTIELHGGAILPNGTQEVYQRVYKEGGGFNEYLAGAFIYHPEHTHIHFDDYAVYSLRAKTAGDGVGPILASGGKVSFCLLDVARYTPGSPAAHYATCNQTQGISAGWADVYAANLPDQWIDVTDIPAGDYWLEVSIDPENRLRESNETNNITRVSVTIGSSNSDGDRFEMNNSTATATDLGVVTHRVEEGLSINTSTDDDYFRVTAAGNGALNISIAFDHSAGDIELTLLSPAGVPIASSEGSSDLEQVTAQVQHGVYYFIHVFGYSGDTNANYRLTVDGPSALGTVSGAVWNDLDADGIRDAGEAGLAGRLVYVDENHNGQFDSAPPVVQQFTPHDVPLTIADASTATSTISVTGLARPIASVAVTLSIMHTYDEDLDVFLISPTGTRVELFSDVGGDGKNFLSTTLRDTASLSITNGTAPFSGAFRPEQSLSTLAGQSANGVWRLEITDDAATDVGSLLDWSITITTEGHFEPSAITSADGTYAIGAAPAGTVSVRQEVPPLWRITYPAPTPVHVVDVTTGGTTSGVNFGNVATTAPRVTDVVLRRSTNAAVSYVLPSGLGQVAPVMLPGLDEIEVTFDRAWNVAAGLFSLAGVNVASYALAASGGFTVVNAGSNTSEMTVVWKLAAPIDNDRLLLTIQGAGVLDGEWSNPGSSASSLFPSGNGDAGGDFAFQFNVLPGDANQDGQVSTGDLAELLHHAFVGQGADGFLPTIDLNGDLAVNVRDALLIRDQLGTALPTGSPGGSPIAEAPQPQAAASLIARASGLTGRRRAAVSAIAIPSDDRLTDFALTAGEMSWSLRARRVRSGSR